MRRYRFGAFFALFGVLCAALIGVGGSSTPLAGAATGTMSRALITVPDGVPANLKAGYYRFTAINVTKGANGWAITLSGDTNANGQDYTLAFAPPTGENLVSASPYNAEKTAGPGVAKIDFIANGGTPCASTFGSLHVRSYTESGGQPTSIALDFSQRCNNPNGPVTNGWIAWNQPYEPLGNPPTGEYVGLNAPARLLDTRQPAGGGSLGQGATRTRNPADVGVPGGAIAVAVNVTAVNPTGEGYLSLYPAGGSVPTVSNVNFKPGDTVPNLAIVQLGAGGITVLNSTGNTDVVLDVMGYFMPGASGSRLNSFAPFRVLDTRLVGAPATGGIPYSVAIDKGATAVLVNVTVVSPTSTGYATVYEAGQFAPLASNLNFRPGQVVANLAIAKVNADGAISIFLNSGQAHLVVDVVGVFNSDRSTGRGRYVPISPTRAIDSRINEDGVTELTLNQGLSYYAGLTGRLKSFPFEYGTVVMNTTVTNTDAGGGYLTVFPARSGVPPTSNMNWLAGETRANLVISGMDEDGFVQMFNSSPSVDYIFDVAGWFTP